MALVAGHSHYYHCQFACGFGFG